MNIVYYGEDFPETITKSLFLAGCSSRNPEEVKSWRPDALQILDDIGFEDGTVFIPEFRDGKRDESMSYEDIVNFENKFLESTDIIVFWMPRDLTIDNKGNAKNLGLISNVEFGKYKDSGKIVLGFPEDAERMSYLSFYAEKLNVPVENTLTATLEQALTMIGDGSERTEGERYIPLFIWKTKSFQNWYKAQTDAGNKLKHAEVLWVYRPAFKNFVFLWILKVAIYVSSEDRIKDNEFVLSRTDISSVLLWKPNLPFETSEIVLIKEFRSPAATKDGFIRELPGGSSWSEKDDPKTIASEEISEETGFYLSPNRLISHDAKQLMGILSAHKLHFYSAHLTEEEITWFKSQKDVVHGNEEDSERTFIEVWSMRDILNEKVEIDWTTMGCILCAYYKAHNNPDLWD